MEAAWGVIILPAVNLRLFLTSHYQPWVDYWLNVDKLVDLFLVNLGCHFSCYSQLEVVIMISYKMVI